MEETKIRSRCLTKDSKKRPRVFSQDLAFIIFYGICSIGLSFLTVEFSLVSPSIIRQWWLVHPAIILVNALLVFLLLLFLHGISRKVQVPLGITALLIVGFSYASHMKILNRKDPVVFADLVLFREAIGIVKEGNFIKEEIGLKILLGLVLLLIIFLLPLGFYSISKKRRAIYMLSSLGIFAISLPLIYSVNSPLYEYLPTRDPIELNKSLTFQDQGILYSFVTYRKVNKVEKPKPFLNNTVAEYRRAFAVKSPQSKPDIVMVMGEAWSDLSMLETFEFSKGQDPFLPMKFLQKGLLKTGDLIVPSFGGGTSNTEFDALTGNSTLLLSDNSFSAFAAIRSEKESLPRLLRSHGYQTYGLHPGNEWFYNRKKVYKDLGFEEGVFLEDFTEPQMKGPFVSEEEGANKLKEKIRDFWQDPRPYFAFYVTIQNHSPYVEDKYNEPLDSFTSKKRLTQEEKISLETYFEGIRDMNREMVNICRELEDSTRPTIFLYFGDHLPSLAKGMETLENIGLEIREGDYDGIWPTYRVPFLLWANSAYWNAYPEFADTPNTISANYLPTLILQAMGGEEMDPFFYYLRQMRDEMPVMHRFFYFSQGGEIIRPSMDLSPSQKEKDQIYKTWQYLRAK